MYEAHFGFREKPFTLLPDPAFLFLGKRHSAALSLLEYSLENQAGFGVLTGAIGSGKTTLVRHLLEHAARDVVVGLISTTHRNLGELLTWVLLAFGLKPAGTSKAELYQAFVDFLLAQYAADRRTVLIVDEAQNLGADALEELRLLSNINADKHQVLQTLLVGQPELRSLLQRPELSQFAQRVSAYFHLDPLDPAETAAYIHHRLTLAGGDPELFHADACGLVHRYSGGVPRVINVICDTALAYGYGAELSRIGAELVREVVWDKVQAGLFSLPAGIEADELEVADGSGASATGAHGTGSGETHGAVALQPGSQGTATQREALQAPAATSAAGEHAVSADRVPSVADIPLNAFSSAPQADRLGFPSSLTGAGNPAKARDGKRHAVSNTRGGSTAEHVRPDTRPGKNDGPAGTQDSARGSTRDAPVGPLPYERRAPARKGRLHAALAIIIGAPLLFLAGQALHKHLAGQVAQERVSETGQQNPEQPAMPVSDFPPAARSEADSIVNGTIPAAPAAVTADAAPPVALFHEQIPERTPPEPILVEAPSGATDNESATQVPVTAAHDNMTDSADVRLGAQEPPGVHPTVPFSAPDASDEPSFPTSAASESEAFATTDTPPEAPALRPAVASVASEEADGPPLSVADTRPESHSDSARQELDRKIARLLKLAEQALVESRLTIPEGGSAYYYYQRILELDAENAPAREGIEVIIRSYARMARSAMARNDYVKAERYLTRGLRMQPENPGLVALKEEVASGPQ